MTALLYLSCLKKVSIHTYFEVFWSQAGESKQWLHAVFEVFRESMQKYFSIWVDGVWEHSSSISWPKLSQPSGLSSSAVFSLNSVAQQASICTWQLQKGCSPSRYNIVATSLATAVTVNKPPGSLLLLLRGTSRKGGWWSLDASRFSGSCQAAGARAEGDNTSAADLWWFLYA